MNHTYVFAVKQTQEREVCVEAPNIEDAKRIVHERIEADRIPGGEISVLCTKYVPNTERIRPKAC